LGFKVGVAEHLQCIFCGIGVLLQQLEEGVGNMAGARGAQEEEEIGKLLLCASQGDLTGLETILQGGLAVDSADYDGRTALHLAASEGHVPALKLLLKHKPNVNPVDRKGDTVSQADV
jgi:ankyrin repeat protein